MTATDSSSSDSDAHAFVFVTTWKQALSLLLDRAKSPRHLPSVESIIDEAARAEAAHPQEKIGDLCRAGYLLDCALIAKSRFHDDGRSVLLKLDEVVNPTAEEQEIFRSAYKAINESAPTLLFACLEGFAYACEQSISVLEREDRALLRDVMVDLCHQGNEHYCRSLQSSLGHAPHLPGFPDPTDVELAEENHLLSSVNERRCDEGSLTACEDSLLMNDEPDASRRAGAVLSDRCSNREMDSCAVLAGWLAQHGDIAEAQRIAETSCASGSASGCLKLLMTIPRGEENDERRIENLRRYCATPGAAAGATTGVTAGSESHNGDGESICQALAHSSVTWAELRRDFQNAMLSTSDRTGEGFQNFFSN